METEPEQGKDVEPVAAGMRGQQAIVIRDLKKDFRGFRKETVHAVQGVNLDIYPGEITAILGHNGAGGLAATILGFCFNLVLQANPPCLTC
jgi:ABC-type glutathione transport system ATPase component